MILAHYSREPLRIVNSVPQAEDLGDGYGSEYRKPEGFWVTDDDAEQSWLDFCISEDFWLDRFAYRTPIEVISDRVFVINNGRDFQDFEDRYLRETEDVLGYRRRGIDWLGVAGDYAGVIITPYHWAYRLVSPWYYGWDCASGCIWDASAISVGESQPFAIPEHSREDAA